MMPASHWSPACICSQAWDPAPVSSQVIWLAVHIALAMLPGSLSVSHLKPEW